MKKSKSFRRKRSKAPVVLWVTLAIFILSLGVILLFLSHLPREKDSLRRRPPVRRSAVTQKVEPSREKAPSPERELKTAVEDFLFLNNLEFSETAEKGRLLFKTLADPQDYPLLQEKFTLFFHRKGYLLSAKVLEEEKRYLWEIFPEKSRESLVAILVVFKSLSHSHQRSYWRTAGGTHVMLAGHTAPPTRKAEALVRTALALVPLVNIPARVCCPHQGVACGVLLVVKLLGLADMTKVHAALLAVPAAHTAIRLPGA